jgi:uncharacterized protein YjgD (DUF1641 family)
MPLSDNYSNITSSNSDYEEETGLNYQPEEEPVVEAKEKKVEIEDTIIKEVPEEVITDSKKSDTTFWNLLFKRTIDEDDTLDLLNQYTFTIQTCKKVNSKCDELKACNNMIGEEDHVLRLEECDDFVEVCEEALNWNTDGTLEKMEAIEDPEIFDSLYNKGKELREDTTELFEDLEKSVSFCENYDPYEAKRLEEKKIQQLEDSLVSNNLAQFRNDFFGGTNLQREEMWKGINNKPVKWTFYVNDVDTDIFGTYVILGTVSKPTEYTFSYDVTVKFKDSEKENLLKLSEGDIITIIAYLDYYGDTLEIIQVDNAKIVEKEVIQYASSGENSEQCVDVENRCNTGDGNYCLMLMQLQQAGAC